MAWSVRSGVGSVVHPAAQNSEVEDDAYSATSLHKFKSAQCTFILWHKYTYCGQLIYCVLRMYSIS